MSARTTARACTSVGTVTTVTQGPKGSPGPESDQPIAELWSGTRWTRQPVPSPAAGGWLNALSCTGPHSCTAVGGAYTANGATVLLSETRTGTRWVFAPAASPASAYDSILNSILNSIACTAPHACIAVGSYLALTNATVTLAMTP